MINRISRLQRLGRFVDLQCTTGGQGDFSEFNVIYALNASGKSTLCDVMRSMSANEPSYLLGRRRLDAEGDPMVIAQLATTAQPATVRFQGQVWHNVEHVPVIHVYDERFVADNVLVGHQIDLAHRRNLYGLVIGNQGIALQQDVDNAEATLAAAAATFNSAELHLNSLLPGGYSIESFREVQAVENVDEEIEDATQNLETSAQRQRIAESIRQRERLTEITIPAIPDNLDQVLSSTLDGAALVAEQRIREHLAEHSHGLSIDWLGKGYRAQRDTTCPHCGQEMDGLDILDSYRAFFSGELQDQEQARESVKRLVDQAFGPAAQAGYTRAIEKNETERDWWRTAAAFDFNLPLLWEEPPIASVIANLHQALTAALARKQAAPGGVITLTDAEQAAVAEWEDAARSLSLYNQGLATINSILLQRQDEAGNIDLAPLRSRLGLLQASQRRHQEDVILAYTAYDAAVADKATAQQVKQTANEALRTESNRIFESYGDRINELLRLFAVDFSIVSDGVNFRGGPPSGQLVIEILGTRVGATPNDAADPSRPSLANTLSGGDRSALALAFFIATVEQDTSLAENIVVFDDPFHSQDRSRQRCTIEKIHTIAQRAKQCFVFSHDLDFARAVEPAHGVSRRTFTLSSLGATASLIADDLPVLPSRAYEQKYAMITEYIAHPERFNDCLLQVAMTLRTILEEYLQLKFPLRWEEGRDWFGTMIGKIRDSEGDDPLVCCQGLVPELTRVNEYSQGFHHRTRGLTGDVPDARELIGYAERTLSIIHQ